MDLLLLKLQNYHQSEMIEASACGGCVCVSLSPLRGSGVWARRGRDPRFRRNGTSGVAACVPVAGAEIGTAVLADTPRAQSGVRGPRREPGSCGSFGGAHTEGGGLSPSSAATARSHNQASSAMTSAQPSPGRGSRAVKPGPQFCP